MCGPALRILRSITIYSAITPGRQMNTLLTLINSTQTVLLPLSNDDDSIYPSLIGNDDDISLPALANITTSQYTKPEA